SRQNPCQVVERHTVFWRYIQRLLILGDCFFNLSLFAKGAGNTPVSFCVPWTYRERLLPLGDRLVDPALLKEDRSKIEICIRVIRTQSYVFLKVFDCFIPKLLSGKSVTKVVLNECRTKAVMGLS